MIPEIKNILYATDLTKTSAYAFRYAVHSARQNGARIHLVHVVEKLPGAEDPYVAADLMQEKMDRIFRTRKDELVLKIKKRLVEFCRRELAGNPDLFENTSIQVLAGDPAGQILQEADAVKADLIIMGTHGKGFFGHSVLGSVAESVLRRGKIPVLVIPIPEKTDISFEDFA